jgi:hypothetical protein
MSAHPSTRGARWLVRVLALALAGGTTMAATSLPAAADPPETFESSYSLVEPDPCAPGTLMTVFFELEGAIHDHDNNRVERGRIAITSSTGYVGRDVFTAVFTPNTFSVSEQSMVANPDTGDRFKVHIVIVENQGGLRVERASFTCIGRGSQ